MTLPPIQAIEHEVAHLHRLRFSPPIEERFEAEGRAQRIRIAQTTILVVTALYDVFLLTDRTILPDIWVLLAALRLGVFTPIALLIVWLLPRTRRDWQIDAMVAGGTVTAVLLPSIAMVFSTSHYVPIYQFGTMLTITYMALVQRVRFRVAVVALAFVLVIQFWTVGLRPDIDARTYEFIVSFYLIAAVLILLGSLVLERTERYGFLQRLRVEILNRRIEETSRTDQLTGLFNRHHLATVADELAVAGRTGPLAALLIDIDHFKRFNDTQGHLAGDRCIRSVSTLVREMIACAYEGRAGSGTAVRFGGEEILVLLPGMGAAEAETLGEAIRRRIEGERIAHPGLGADTVVTTSIGVAGWIPDAADTALYRAKNGGRNRVARFGAALA